MAANKARHAVISWVNSLQSAALETSVLGPYSLILLVKLAWNLKSAYWADLFSAMKTMTKTACPGTCTWRDRHSEMAMIHCDRQPDGLGSQHCLAVNERVRFKFLPVWIMKETANWEKNVSIFDMQYPLVNWHRPWQIGFGRLVSIKNWWFSGSMFIYQRVMIS